MQKLQYLAQTKTSHCAHYANEFTIWWWYNGAGVDSL